MSADDTLALTVTDARAEARDAMIFELRAPGGGTLPPFTAGAHLEVHLAPKLIRHYSLCNDPAERDRYQIGVGLARDSRGGSSWMHHHLRLGMTLTVSAPRNHFPLDAGASPCCFIAGGIGITPIMAMIRQAQRQGRPWQLHYCARNRQRMAFYETLQTLAPARCHLHLDDEQGGALFDANAALAGAPADAQIYTCGPAPLMRAVEAAAITAGRPAEQLHFEWFSAAAPATGDADSAFTVVLRSSGRRLQVPAGQSILEVLEENDAGVPYSCREGLCATCRTGVLAGVPDHRDQVLSAAEREAGDCLLICVSRAKTPELELDL